MVTFNYFPTGFLARLEKEKSEAKKERPFNFIDKHTFSIPKDYKFNREELYER